VIDHKTFLEIKEEIVTDIQTNVDENANLSPSDVLGQLLNITSFTASEIYDNQEEAQNQNTILASDEYLDLQLAQLGKKRDRGARAVIYDFQIVTDASCTLTTTDYFQNAEGLQFRPITGATFSAGTHTLDVEAVEIGSIGSLADNTVDEIVSPVSGLVSVNNPPSTTFQDGRDVEIDESCRIRIQSESNSKEYTENAITKAVANIDGVRGCNIIDDIQNTRFEVIVDQTDTSEDVNVAICETIAYVKPAGIKAYSGASNPNNIERVIEIGNKSYVNIAYSRAETVPIYIRLTTVPTLTTDQKNALKAYLAAWGDEYLAGEDVIVYGTDSIFTAVTNWTGTTFTSLAVEVSLNGSSWSSSNISISAREVARISSSNITVNP
jgi:hypothetical protein